MTYMLDRITDGDLLVVLASHVAPVVTATAVF